MSPPLGSEVVALFLATAVVAFASAALVDPRDVSAGSLLARIVGQQVVAVLGVALVVARLGMLTRPEIVGAWSPNGSWLMATVAFTGGWAILQTPVVRLWAAITGTAAPEWWDQAASGTSSGAMLAASIALAVVPPICEEVFFRGVFLHRLRALGTVAAIAIQAAIFAAYHLDPYGAPVQVIAGILLGLLRVGSGALLPCILAHALNNGAALWELHRASTLYDELGGSGMGVGLVLVAVGGLMARHAVRAAVGARRGEHAGTTPES